MLAILIIATVITIYLIGNVNGRSARDDKAREDLATERHLRICAQQMYDDTKRELHRALVANEALERQNDMLLLKHIRHGLDRQDIESLVSAPKELQAPHLRAVS